MKGHLEIMFEITHHLDIRHELCPMTFVKTKLMLERMQQGEIIELRLAYGEAADHMPASLTEQGHKVLSSDGRASEMVLLVQKG